MRIDLEAIHFNHDEEFQTTGAFSIRRNENCPIIVPEWRRNMSLRPEDAPAAYAYERVKNLPSITIKATFSCGFDVPEKVVVRTQDGHQNPENILGIVVKTEVNFVDGKGEATLLLDNVRILELGVGVGDVIWNWQYSVNGEEWVDFATSLHRIYTVIDMPSQPWQPQSTDIKDTQRPWIEVLDFACRAAAGTKTLSEAATMITQWANNLGPGFVQYDNPGNGWTGFTVEEPPRFDCTEFLLLLNGGKNLQGPSVNCDDCAAIVVTFSNVLGCRLSEGRMGKKSFAPNRHLRIGRDGVFRGSFSYHTVSWLGECKENDPLFDSCVRLDVDADLANELWIVPVDIPFSVYRPRLTKDAESCIPIGKLPVRTIGLEPVSNGAALEGTGEQQVDSSFITLADVGSLVEGLSTAESSKQFRLITFRFIRTRDTKYLLQSFWCLQDEAEISSKISFSVEMFECNSSADVPAIRDKILGRFNVPGLERIEDATFGTEAYAPPDNRFVIVFVREEFVFLVRNTGNDPVSCENLAGLIDKFLVDEK